MTTMLLATVVAMRLAAAPQSFDIQAQEGQPVHLTITSHCSCYKPQPTVVVPDVDVFDAAGHRIELPKLIVRGTSRGTADYTLEGDVTFTAPASGTYSVRITPAAIRGYVDAIQESFSASSSNGSRTGVLSSSYGSMWTPIAASQSGKVTLTIE